jgi:MoaA/NifB/PqqE/SkfB family radical SAM enzyme
MRLRDAARRGTRLALAHATGRAVPFHVTLSVTERCNHHCVYCTRPESPGQELTTAEWSGVLGELRSLGTERVIFFGGEPLLRDDLGTIVSCARLLGLRCALATNGVLVPQRRDVVTLFQTLVISLDGDAEAHDRNRGAGSHAQALAAIEAARAWDIPVKVNAVLNANNVQSLDWVLKFCEARRLPLTLNIMRSEDSGLWNMAAKYRLSDDEVRALLDRILVAMDTYKCILFSRYSVRTSGRWADYTRDRLAWNEVKGSVAGPSCSAGRFHCIIKSDGRLFPCSATVGQVPGLNVRDVGVAKALERAGEHDCATCHGLCLIEVNGLFGLRPRVLLGLSRTYLRNRIE